MVRRTLKQRLKRWRQMPLKTVDNCYDCYVDAAGFVWPLITKSKLKTKTKTTPLRSKSSRNRRHSAVETAYSWALMRFYTLIVKRQSIRLTQSFNKWKYIESSMKTTTAPSAPSTSSTIHNTMPLPSTNNNGLPPNPDQNNNHTGNQTISNGLQSNTSNSTATANSNGTIGGDLLDDKYVRMLNVGLSTEIVQQKMIINGDDPAVLLKYLNVTNTNGSDGTSDTNTDNEISSNKKSASKKKSYFQQNFSSTASQPTSKQPTSQQPTPAMSPVKSSELGKYHKMLDMGIPLGAVQQRMLKDGIDPSLLNSISKSVTKNKPKRIDNSTNLKYMKYFKMLTMGIPRGAVENKMKQDGIDSSILDGADPNAIAKAKEATTATPSTVFLKDSKMYSKYFKMLKMGIPNGAVKNKMIKDGVNPNHLDLGPNAYEPLPAPKKLPKQSTVLLKDSKIYGKYFKMLKMRIPIGAVKNKMEKDDVDPSILDLGPDAYEPLPPSLQTTMTLLLKDDPTFTKYFKMLDVGLPPQAVKHRMTQDKMDPKVLDMDLNGPSPNQPNQASKLLLFHTDSPKKGKKKKKKKPGDGLVRKKIHWRKLSGLRLASSMWGTGHADSKQFVLQPKREIKEMTALFCQSMDPKTGAGSPGRGHLLGASQQAGRGGSKLKKENSAGGGRKKKATLLDMTRANNISIVLARFDDVSLTKITQAVCSLNASDMSSEHLRSLLGLAPTKDEADILKKYNGK